MRQISLVGAVDEEVGNYFPEFLGMLEESPFLKVSQERVNGSNANRKGWRRVNGKVIEVFKSAQVRFLQCTEQQNKISRLWINEEATIYNVLLCCEAEGNVSQSFSRSVVDLNVQQQNLKEAVK